MPISATTIAVVFAASTAAFLMLYFTAALIGHGLTHKLLPALAIGAVVDSRPLREAQVQKEIRRSLISIVIFGGYGALTFIAWSMGTVRVDLAANWLKIAIDIILLLIWNELHFYAMHRLLHTRWLYRHVHRIHHEAVVPTPFSTYSFHWLEAAMLGSVMILPMLVYDFSIIALALLPVLSIILNTIGHANYNVFAKHPQMHSASVQHSLHHQRVGGNYGFYLPYIDRLVHSALQRRTN